MSVCCIRLRLRELGQIDALRHAVDQSEARRNVS